MIVAATIVYGRRHLEIGRFSSITRKALQKNALLREGVSRSEERD